ncbi:MAG: DUF309 domain-containing protein [Pseudonocardiaceae bacterium]
MNSRDRDAAGRARNARPRDALGRPLPRDAHGVARVPEDVVLSPDEAVRRAQRFIDDGYPFHAHEVFEAAWKSIPGPERELWRGLAQIAVGLTHARRGNARGAMALLRRGADRVAGFAGASSEVDAGFVAGQAAGLALRIEQEGLTGIPEADLRLRLQPG